MSNISIQPLYDRVAIEPFHEEKTQGGIIIPDTTKEKPSKGKILAVGEGYRSEDGRITPLRVQAGDTVMYGKWSGSEVKVEGKDIIILKESELLAICKET